MGGEGQWLLLAARQGPAGQRHWPAGLSCACPALKPGAHPGSLHSSLSQSVLSQFEFSQPQPLCFPSFPPMTRQTPRHLPSTPTIQGDREVRSLNTRVSKVRRGGLPIPSRGRSQGKACKAVRHGWCWSIPESCRVHREDMHHLLHGMEDPGRAQLTVDTYMDIGENVAQNIRILNMLKRPF